MVVMSVIGMAGLGILWRLAYLRRADDDAGPKNAMRAVAPAPGGRVAESGGPDVPRAAAGGALAAAAEANLPDGVYPRAGGGRLVKAGDAFVYVGPGRGEGRVLRGGFFTMDEAEWGFGYLVEGVRRILAEPAYAGEVGVTAAQRDALAALPSPPDLAWPREELEGLAARVDAAVEAVALLRQTATVRRAAGHGAMRAYAARMRTVLSAEQVSRLDPIPRWEFPPEVRVPATTRPK